MKIILLEDHFIGVGEKKKGQVFEVTRSKRDELIRLKAARDYPTAVDVAFDKVKQIVKRRK